LREKNVPFVVERTRLAAWRKSSQSRKEEATKRPEGKLKKSRGKKKRRGAKNDTSVIRSESAAHAKAAYTSQSAEGMITFKSAARKGNTVGKGSSKSDREEND